MNTQLDLNEIEKRAFRATHQDGLMDINLAFIVTGTGLMFSGLGRDEFPISRLILATVGILLGSLIFWVGKKYITVPRIGQARFGPARQQKGRRLVAILAVVVMLQVVMVLLPVLAWASPSFGATLNRWLPAGHAESLLVAGVAVLFAGPGMLVMFYFTDFLRGYYITGVFSLGIFLAIWLAQPYYLFLAAALIGLPGLVLFVRFLRRHPRVPEPEKG